MSERLDDWMEAYIEAWTTNDEHDIAALFTPDAVYDPQTADGEQHGVACSSSRCAARNGCPRLRHRLYPPAAQGRQRTHHLARGFSPRHL